MLKKVFGILAVVGFLAGTGIACYFIFSQDQNGQSDQNPQSTWDQGMGRIFPVTSYTTSNLTELKMLSKEEKDKIVEIIITGSDYGEYEYVDDYDYDADWTLEKDTFEGFDNLKTVKMINTLCNLIENGTFDNLNIEELVFARNSFWEVDHAIQNITTLQRLTMDDNALTSYPESLEFLVGYPNLKYLGLIGMEINRFPRLPESIDHLVWRGLSKPPPVLTYLKNLRTADFSGMSAVSASLNKHNLPQSVRNLVMKDTGFANGKTNFSTAFLGLKNLESLDLSTSRELTEIDSEFPNSRSLKKLKVLDLSNSPIEKLSKKTFRHLKSLEVIGLHGMSLKYVDPSWFKHNKMLQTLRISGNPFDCNEKFREALDGFKKEKYVLEDATTEFPRFIPEGEYETFFCTKQKVVHHGHHHHHHDHKKHEENESEDHDHHDHSEHEKEEHDHHDHPEDEKEEHNHHDHSDDEKEEHDHYDHSEDEKPEHDHHHQNEDEKEEHDHHDHSEHEQEHNHHDHSKDEKQEDNHHDHSDDEQEHNHHDHSEDEKSEHDHHHHSEHEKEHSEENDHLENKSKSEDLYHELSNQEDHDVDKSQDDHSDHDHSN